MTFSQPSDPTQTNRVFKELVAREWSELISGIRLDKQCSGLTYDDFEALMIKFGYACETQRDLLQMVFSLFSTPKYRVALL